MRGLASGVLRLGIVSLRNSLAAHGDSWAEWFWFQCAAACLYASRLCRWLGEEAHRTR